MINSSSPTSARPGHPNIEINVVDHFGRKGYRFKGTAQLPDDGTEFARYVAFFSDRGMLDAPGRIRAIVIVRVDQARPVISPGYDQLADEASMRAYWSSTIWVIGARYDTSLDRSAEPKARMRDKDER
jgi:hypothetical protein